MLRKAAIVGATFLALVIAALPLVLTVALGWLDTTILGSQVGAGGDVFVVLAVVYAVWLPATVVGMIYLYDRLGYHYFAQERQKKPSRRERRRARAGLELLAGQEKAGQEAAVVKRKGAS
jgi:hypothetical protein